MPSRLQYSGDGSALYQDAQQSEKWRQNQRNGPSQVHQSEEADSITALLLYLADGYETECLAARSAALLLFVRPDLIGARNYRGMAQKLGVNPAALVHAVRVLRETLPFKAGFSPAKISTTRLLSLGQIRARRRQLWIEHVERMAEARKIAAGEFAREFQRRRLRVARANIEHGQRFALKFAQEMAAFDAALGLTPVSEG